MLSCSQVKDFKTDKTDGEQMGYHDFVKGVAPRSDVIQENFKGS